MSEAAPRTFPLSGRSGEQINRELLAPVVKATRGWWILTGLTTAGVGAALLAWLYQINSGMGVAGINNPVGWGFYIINFVFWIGISHSGTMISAILRLNKAEWRYPITRAAEAMTLFSVIVAQFFPLVHLGRVWLFWYLIPLPWGRGLWPNFRSPLLWDGVAISTYLTCSSLFLYLATIPDMATYRDRVGGWRRHVYAALSLGWRGTHLQWRWHQRASLIVTVLIIPVAVSVHTIVAWDFGMSVVPGWHSTIFAPYFVVGAIFSGVAAVISLMFVLRWAFDLHDYFTPFHFDQLGRMLLGVSFLWTFMFATETLTVYFAAEASEQPGLIARTFGHFWPLFVVMLMANSVIPMWYLSSGRRRRRVAGLFVVTLLINVGMWIERFLIVIPSLTYKGTPFSWGDYAPTFVELTITFGSFCGFALLYLLFVRIVPLVPAWEIKEGQHVLSHVRSGANEIPARLAPIDEPGWPPPASDDRVASTS